MFCMNAAEGREICNQIKVLILNQSEENVALIKKNQCPYETIYTYMLS